MQGAVNASRPGPGPEYGSQSNRDDIKSFIGFLLIISHFSFAFFL